MENEINQKQSGEMNNSFSLYPLAHSLQSLSQVDTSQKMKYVAGWEMSADHPAEILHSSDFS